MEVNFVSERITELLCPLILITYVTGSAIAQAVRRRSVTVEVRVRS